MPTAENGQLLCILPSAPYAIPAKLKTAIARNDRRTNDAEIFLNISRVFIL